ncbi:transcriptional regulator [Mergibacter septicus]|nr:transcriptional regulator [Mergibacter septicus]
MRFAIECIDRIGVAREVLALLADEQINLQGIELQKIGSNGVIFIKIDDIAEFQVAYLCGKLGKIAGVKQVKSINYLPNERRSIELNALLESLPNPVLSLDLNGKIEFANQQARMLLLPLLEVKAKNQPLLSVYQPDSLQGIALTKLLPELVQASCFQTFIASPSKSDPQLSLHPISLSVPLEDETWRLDLLPVYLHENSQQQLLGSVAVLQSHQSLRIDLHQFSASQNNTFADVIAESDAMANLVDQAKKFAFLDAPLLIQGETGSGKELIAKACHNLSFRNNKRFIAVNCAGLPAEEAESEMFGYRGAGKETIGFFEYADGGTVLLDNIAELSLPMQAKLLRFLNDGTFRRVGEEAERYVDVRVICTSQIPLSVYVEQGVVREDLYHRLNVLTLNIPALRDRQADIPALVKLFVEQITRRFGIPKPYYSADFVRYLIDYNWSGNVRELHNALYRACSLVENGELTIAGLKLKDKLLPAFNLESFTQSLNQANQPIKLDQIVGQFEASILQKFYLEYPSTRKLAQYLGVSHTAIANKLRQYGIKK